MRQQLSDLMVPRMIGLQRLLPLLEYEETDATSYEAVNGDHAL